MASSQFLIEFLNELELKGERLVCLAEEVLRQDSIQIGAEEAAVVDKEVRIIVVKPPVLG